MSLDTAFADAVDDCTKKAMTPGWYSHAQHKIDEIEADKKHETTLFKGLRAAVEANLKAAQFTPRASERGQWWVIKSEAEKGWPIFKPREPVVVYAERKGRK